MRDLNSRLLLPALLAVALGGCSSSITDVSLGDLNPLKKADPVRSEDYNYFYRREAVSIGPVSQADLVGPDGRCGSSPAYAPAPSPALAAPVAQTPRFRADQPAQQSGALFHGRAGSRPSCGCRAKPVAAASAGRPNRHRAADDRMSGGGCRGLHGPRRDQRRSGRAAAGNIDVREWRAPRHLSLRQRASQRDGARRGAAAAKTGRQEARTVALHLTKS